ncbi:MAG TPA: hypothetical protein VNN13_03445, partial [Methylomirabilota bacterium]|nr:hypothetical protein [Methylomirabilota bacterium]
HGWLFDRRGNCLEQPCEPPLFLAYEPFLAPGGHVLATKIFHECNYFQANEGNLDPSHVSYLHRQANVPENLKRPVQGSGGKLPLALYEADPAPHIDIEETGYGVRIFSTRKADRNRTFLRVTHFIMPNKPACADTQTGRRFPALCPATATIFTGTCRSTTRTTGATISSFAAARRWRRRISGETRKSSTSGAPATARSATRPIAIFRIAKR